MIRFWPLALIPAIAAGWLYVTRLQDQLSAALSALSMAETTIAAWERINDADISSGDSVADRGWLLSRAK